MKTNVDKPVKDNEVTRVKDDGSDACPRSGAKDDEIPSWPRSGVKDDEINLVKVDEINLVKGDEITIVKDDEITLVKVDEIGAWPRSGKMILLWNICITMLLVQQKVL